MEEVLDTVRSRVDTNQEGALVRGQSYDKDGSVTQCCASAA